MLADLWLTEKIMLFEVSFVSEQHMGCLPTAWISMDIFAGPFRRVCIFLGCYVIPYIADEFYNYLFSPYCVDYSILWVP